MYAERIGIIRGGEAYERERSLALGAALMSVIKDSGYDVVDIFVDGEGVWWKEGVATDPSRVCHVLSMAIPVFPGASPIASRVARLSEEYGVPYLGASPMIEGVAHHPEGRAHALLETGISAPRTVSLHGYDAPTAEELAYNIVRAHALPLRIMTIPSDEYTHTKRALGSVRDVRDALAQLRPGLRNVFLEEDVQGHHATVYCIDGFRGRERYTFPPVPTISGAPIVWSKEEGKNAEHVAHTVADVLSLEGFVRADLTITPKNIVVRDIRTTPDFTSSSPLYDALFQVGATKKEVVEHIVHLVTGGRL